MTPSEPDIPWDYKFDPSAMPDSEWHIVTLVASETRLTFHMDGRRA